MYINGNFECSFFNLFVDENNFEIIEIKIMDFLKGI